MLMTRVGDSVSDALQDEVPDPLEDGACEVDGEGDKLFESDGLAETDCSCSKGD